MNYFLMEEIKIMTKSQAELTFNHFHSGSRWGNFLQMMVDCGRITFAQMNEWM